RSGCRDNLVYKNLFQSDSGTTGGLEFSGSNSLCDENGVICSKHFPPSCDPGCPCLECRGQKNLFYSNSIITTGKGVDHYGDGKNNVFQNNLSQAPNPIYMDYCDAGAPVTYINNTLDAKSGVLIQIIKSECALNMANNILYSAGSGGIALGGGTLLE